MLRRERKQILPMWCSGSPATEARGSKRLGILPHPLTSSLILADRMLIDRLGRRSYTFVHSRQSFHIFASSRYLPVASVSVDRLLGLALALQYGRPTLNHRSALHRIIKTIKTLQSFSVSSTVLPLSSVLRKQDVRFRCCLGRTCSDRFRETARRVSTSHDCDTKGLFRLSSCPNVTDLPPAL